MILTDSKGLSEDGLIQWVVKLVRDEGLAPTRVSTSKAGQGKEDRAEAKGDAKVRGSKFAVVLVAAPLTQSLDHRARSASKTTRTVPMLGGLVKNVVGVQLSSTMTMTRRRGGPRRRIRTRRRMLSKAARLQSTNENAAMHA